MAQKLTEIERQILANQFKILACLEINKQRNSNSAEIMERGFTGQYKAAFSVNAVEESIDICEETSQILYMYCRINKTIAKLSTKERAKLELEKIEFKGFDADHDPHYRYMKFLVEKMNLWQEYRGSYLNSHSAFSLGKYRKMLKYQNQVDKLNDKGVEDLKNFIKAVK